MKKGTLGAQLRRTIDLGRSARREEAIEAAADDAATTVRSDSRANLVRQLFESARSRIKQIVESEGPLDVCVQIGELGAATTANAGKGGIDALAKACWPLTVAEGIQLQGNLYHADWTAFCRWALGEELVPELYAVHDGRFVRTRHYLRVKPFPV